MSSCVYVARCLTIAANLSDIRHFMPVSILWYCVETQKFKCMCWLCSRDENKNEQGDKNGWSGRNKMCEKDRRKAWQIYLFIFPWERMFPTISIQFNTNSKFVCSIYASNMSSLCDMFYPLKIRIASIRICYKLAIVEIYAPHKITFIQS